MNNVEVNKIYHFQYLNKYKDRLYNIRPNPRKPIDY